MSVPREWKLEFPGETNVAGGCRRIEDGYGRIGAIGEGTYGEVFKAMDTSTREYVAVKKVKMENEKEGFPITAIREIKLLSKLATSQQVVSLPDDREVRLRDSIIRLREIARSDTHKSNKNKGSIYMVFDYMDHDMAGLLTRTGQEGKRFTIPQVKTYMQQLFFGLALLEKNNILHRDLKNANLLVNNEGELKIADFGLARNYIPVNKAQQPVVKQEEGIKGNSSDEAKNPKMTNRVITLWYRPPELCLGADHYGPEVDMWSAGCIMVEMLAGRAIFPGRDELNEMELICNALGRPTEENMPGCTKLERYDEYINNSDIRKMSTKKSLWKAKGLKCDLSSIEHHDKAAVDLINNLLVLDPSKRLSAIQACSHEWFFIDPKPAPAKDMPKHDQSHEMVMKRKREMATGTTQPDAAPRPRIEPSVHQQQQQQHQCHNQMPSSSSQPQISQVKKERR